MSTTDETALRGFVTVFGSRISDNAAAEKDNEQAKRDAAFNELLSLCKHIPDFDDRAAYLEYLDERYGDGQDIQNKMICGDKK